MPKPSARPTEDGWWSRNWKWFVPVVIIGGLAALAAAVLGIATMVFGMMKSSDAYKTAVLRANNDPRVISAMGAPVTEGLLVTGNINLNNDSGAANLAIPLSGPKGSGVIRVEATKSGGVWTYSTLEVVVAGTGEKIDLNKNGDGNSPPAQ